MLTVLNYVLVLFGGVSPAPSQGLVELFGL